MARHSRALCFSVATIVLLASAASGQTIRGRVLDGSTERNVSQVHVAVLSENSDSVLVGAVSQDGSFSLLLAAAGNYRVRAEALGYRTTVSDAFTVASGAVLTVEIRLLADAIALSPLNVVSQRIEPPFMGDVRRRARPGLGRLITREELDERAGSPLDDVLRDAALRSSYPRPDVPVFTARSAGLRDCYATVYINGTVAMSADVFTDTAGPGRARWLDVMETMGELARMKAADIEAIEIYRGAGQVPAEFSGTNAECGVVAIWRRSGYDRQREVVPLAPRVRLRAGVRAGELKVSGFHAPEPTPGLELGVTALFTQRIGTVFYVRYDRSSLSAATTSYLATQQGGDPPDVGPRPLTLITIGVEPRLTLLDGWRVRPVLAGRAQMMRRSVSLPAADGAGMRTHGSYGRGIGASAGLDVSITERLVADAAYGREHLSLGSYAGLNEWERTTGSKWKTTALRIGLGIEF